jgi:NTP pyrophosphatase (non-canonical NTP hydrolase)
MKPWKVVSDPAMQRRLGKLLEELGELTSVVARIGIQGMHEVDPSSGKVNRQRLMDEIADVQAQLTLSTMVFGLDQVYMTRRTAEKMRQMVEWEVAVKENQP